MTCKKCYHNEVCEALYELNGIPRIGATECAYFRDKDRLIEAPCKAGDTAYHVTRLFNGETKIVEGMIFEFAVTHESSERDKCRFYFWAKADTNYTSRQYSKWCDFEDFGKTVFLTREAAEAALEARNAKT